MISNISDYIVKMDRVCDYIPVISSVSNLVDIFQKATLQLVDQFKGPRSNANFDSRYFTYLKDKPYSRCATLIVPVVGNLAVAILDIKRGANARGAVKAIIYALKNNEGSLNLVNYHLTSLPPEIGNLNQLEILNLKHNSLESIPPEIGNLNRLLFLYLKDNKLTSLPEEIGNLNQLDTLNLKNNQLASLPPEIGGLNQLGFLYLDNNSLTSLPSNMHLLSKLRVLSVAHNPDLTELPLSLGQIPTLIEIDIEGTGINPEERDALLNQCKVLRSGKALQILPSRLETWGLKSKKTFNFSQVLKFGDMEKVNVNEWLVRLENTKDFNSPFQSTLANAVCSMLVDAAHDEDFCPLFFSQIETNLECCQDRAAMALNEIFTSWKLSRLDDSAPLKDRLQILARGAKTLALRAAIARRIDQHQKENGAIESEAVEIYLYYETSLKKELDLLSIIENMAYGDIGKREWIKEENLMQEVNATYLNYLIEFDSFEEIIKTDSRYKVEREKKLKPIETRLLNLCKLQPKNIDHNSEEYLSWQSEIGRLNEERKQAEVLLRKEWVQK